ncbi:MAG: 4-hydroxybenzoate polyprenyltransferase [Gammaproteobacteria bacterium RIFCSPLOWO2_02_FULL_38_11]|nr:MAG: 4-hydroxybenzoate polyprenyltransferase [Gammaproteobacteria bacterium RIFCSPLOWO2_02_FULL_38_11]OGT76973.1 MAG: 4-hydroxybenzoate polyprenyltransferase [Gammaproteobacteria bacterium RIFCSPLOWO2_12_FULL_38_14]
MKNKIYLYLELMRFNRPIGIFLLLWPTLWALWLASLGHPSTKHIFIFILGVIIMRSAGCVINDIADRKFDLFVKRTQHRPLTSGKINLKEAIGVFIFLCFIALGLVLCLNPFAIALSLVGLFLAILYPFTKRVSYFPQFFLGLAFAWAVPLVYAATMQSLPFEAWLVFLAALLWPVAYDTFYAMTDKNEDLKIGIFSTAIKWGDSVKIFIFFIYIIFFIILFWVGYLYHLKNRYFVGLVIAMLVAFYQFWIVRNNSIESYFRAFLNNNAIGFIIFLSILVNYYL